MLLVLLLEESEGSLPAEELLLWPPDTEELLVLLPATEELLPLLPLGDELELADGEQHGTKAQWLVQEAPTPGLVIAVLT